MTGPFDGVRALVTGGASGIGAATVAVLRSRGARVAVLDRDPADGQPCDVTRGDEVDRSVAAVTAELGGLDVLVNCAGIGAVGDVAANDDAEWHRVLDVNVVGIARVSRAALPYLRASPCAAVVNVSSVLASTGVPARALYSASKGAVAALTLAMAADHVGDGIRVNAVLPGTTDTPWVGRLLESAADPQQAAEDLRARQAMGRLVTAEEVAEAIAYLAAPANGATTGALLVVDGGFSSLRLPAAPAQRP